MGGCSGPVLGEACRALSPQGQESNPSPVAPRRWTYKLQLEARWMGQWVALPTLGLWVQ
jgi:hypothetical protein